MSGKLVDLSLPSSMLPDAVVLDTSVVVAKMVALNDPNPPPSGVQAAEFFHRLEEDGCRAFLTPTAYIELLHASIRIQCQQVLRSQRQVLIERFGNRITSWRELAKRDPSILRQHADELGQLRRRVITDGVAIVNPHELGPLPNGQSFDEALVRLIGRFGLDSGDASILLETQCLGLNAIVTMDHDLQRALPDFDIYTWLS